MEHEVWSTVLSIIRDIVVGIALGYLAVHLDRVKRRQRAHEREVEEKLGTGNNANSAATGQADNLGQHSRSPDGHRGRVRHP